MQKPLFFASSKKSKSGKKGSSGGASGGSGGDNNDDNNKKEDLEKKTQEVVNDEIKESGEKPVNEPIQGPWGNVAAPKKYTPKDSSKYDKILKDLIGSASDKDSGQGSGQKPDGGDFFDKLDNSPKKLGGLVVLAFAALWLATGFYKVATDENAIVLYFGKFHAITTPGLNYHIPFPVGKVVKQSVTRVNTEEFGIKNARGSRKNTPSDNLMLTGDENIVDIEFQVQWQVSNIEEFTFSASQPRFAIRKAAQSAMREIIARTPISEALSDGKRRIEQEAKELLQQTVDSYGLGVRVVLVQLRRVDPPIQVIDSFRDVQTAKADKEREINEAQAYANDIIPRARGNAAQIQEQALSYSNQVTEDAKGEAKRFTTVLEQYLKAKEITRKRIYLKTMSDVYGGIDKVLIDRNVTKGSVVPYFPLSDLNKAKK